MSDVDWQGDAPDENLGGVDAGGWAGGGVPVNGYPGLFAGDFANGDGALGLRREAAPDVAAGWGPDTPPRDPMDVYEWGRHLGDQGIAYQVDNRKPGGGRLSVFETPDRTQEGNPMRAVGIDEYVPGQQDDQPQDWRRYAPPPGSFPAVRKPIYQDIGAYRAARAYLDTDPESAALGARMDAARMPVVMIPDKIDRFDPRDLADLTHQLSPQGVVYWNPNFGLQVPNSPTSSSALGRLLGPPSAQSPALALDHEFGHADQWLTYPEGYLENVGAKTGDDWDNLEEKRNIEGVETPAARRLGEPTRNAHRGDYVRAPTVPRRK